MPWVLIIGGALLLAACGGESPTYVTRYGAKVYDGQGWFQVGLANDLEPELMSYLEAYGFKRDVMEQCINATSVYIMPPGGAKAEGGPAASSITHGERIVIDTTRDRCLYTYIHELQHRFAGCSGDATFEGAHARPELWGPDSFIERYWTLSCGRKS